MMLHLKCGQAPCTLSASVGPASQTELSASAALALCVLWVVEALLMLPKLCHLDNDLEIIIIIYSMSIYTA